MIGLSVFQAGPLGIALFASVIAAALYALLRQAARLNLFAPVIVAFVVRLVVMVVAQLASGHGGAFYLDDAGYSREATLIAHQWLEGHVINPSSYQYAGSLAFGYQTMVASIFLLTGKSMVAGKLVNVLLGTATVLLVGLLSRRLFGASTMRRAAWLMALIPTSVWWSAVMLKESLVAFLVMAAVLAFVHWPRRSALVAFVLAMSALAVTRSPAMLAITITVLGTLAVGAVQQRRAITMTGLAYVALAGSALLVGFVALSAGHPGSVVHQIGHTLSRLGLEQHQGVGAVVAAIPKSLVSPYPWVFTRSTLTWDRALYPGMWAWYALLPTAIVGLWRLRSRAEGLLFVLPVATLLTVNALTAGFTFRQRSTVEPFLLLLVIAGADSWRRVAGRAAVAYVFVALLATVQSHSLPTGGVIGLVALALALVARRLPPTPTLQAPLQPGLCRDLVILIRIPPRRTLAVAATGMIAGARAGAPQIGDASGRSAEERGGRLLGAVQEMAPQPRAAYQGLGDHANALLAILRGAAALPGAPQIGAASRRSAADLDGGLVRAVRQILIDIPSPRRLVVAAAGMVAGARAGAPQIRDASGPPRRTLAVAATGMIAGARAGAPQIGDASGRSAEERGGRLLGAVQEMAPQPRAAYQGLGDHANALLAILRGAAPATAAARGKDD